MNLEKNIIDLLYKYDCVIVPGFGGFIAQNKSAVFHPMDYTFDPPRKIIGFNSDLLHSDGLLAHDIAKKESITYNEAILAITDTVSSWNATLEAGKLLHLDGLGTFKWNLSHKEFEPQNGLNFSFDSFGMLPVQGQYILRQAQADIDSESKPASTWISYASAVGFAVLVGASAFIANDNIIQPQLSSMLPLLNNNTAPKTQLTEGNATESKLIISEKVKENPSIAKVKAIDTANAVKNIDDSSVESKQNEEEDLSVKAYQVIGGSFKVYSKAMAHQAFLKQQGYDKAIIVGKVGNFYMVAFDTFHDEEIAKQYKRDLEKKGFDVFIRP